MAEFHPTDRPDVSVVVVNYRSAELTLRALGDVAASAAEAGVSVEEIVVDGASGGDDVEVLRRERPGAAVIALDANRGFAAGNNAGIRRADGRYLLLVNPDAFALGGSVGRLVTHLHANPEVGVAAPLLRNEDGSIQDNAYRRFPNLVTLFVDYCAPLAYAVRGTRLDPHNLDRRRLDRPRPIAHASGAVLLVRAEAASDAGPLDERYFMYLEETEWQRRIRAAGWRIDIVPDAAFVHLGGGSSSSYPLASPAYLDSVARYYPRPRAALTVIRVAGLISLVSLRVARRLRPGSRKIAALEESFASLRTELARRPV
jgi:N-acetylglucosaminyl-diphospho-decaprenol L-rhamnosyltransferase